MLTRTQAGKYSPITQWFHFDAFELLAEQVCTEALEV